MSVFIKKQLEVNPYFIKEAVKLGKEHFLNLLKFSEKTGKLNLKESDNKELVKLIEEYFILYKEPYPYFHLTPYPDELEKIGDQKTIQLMGELRLFGRTSFNKTHDLINPLFEEIGKRVSLSVDEIKFLTPDEIKTLLSTEEKIQNRQNCYFIYQNGKFELFENQTFVIKEDLPTELKGRGTFPAFYKGKVKLIKNKDDVKKINQGDVIVLKMTTADLITENMKKAGAIITDEGGITCHAAIISREFNIPALIGTKVATKILKDNDLVEIDTEKGIAIKKN